MSDPIAKLLVTLGMDSTEFSRGAKRALDDVSTMRSKISSAAGVIKGAVGGMITAMALDRIADLAMKGLEYASSLGEVAAQLGVTTKALQQYRYIASQVGIDQETMDKGLAKLTIRIGQAASGNKAAMATFEKFGVSIRDANGEVRDTGDIIPDLADKFVKLGSDAERTAMSAELFGAKLGPKFNTLLAEGSQGINNLRSAANDLGIVLSDELIDNADDAADKLGAVKTVLEAKIASTVAANAKEIVALANALMKLVEAAGKAAKAWRYFSQLDWSPNAASLSDQFTAMQMRDLGPGVELTDSAAAAIKKRDAARFQGSGGSLLRAPPKSTARTPVQNTPWGPVNTNLNRRGNAITAAGFGRLDFAQFEPGGAAADWIKAKGAAEQLKGELTGVDTLVSRIALQTGAKMAQNFRDAAAEGDRLAGAAQSIMDRLFPDDARRREYINDLAILRLQYAGNAEMADKLAEAQRRLQAEWIKSLPAIDSIAAGASRFSRASEEASEKTRAANEQVGASFVEMVDTSLASLDRFIFSIKKGDILGIASGILNLLDSIAGFATGGKGIGLFGKGQDWSLSTRGSGSATGIPGFATGGTMMLGGLSGIDTNLLSLNGRPIARTTAGETMTISPSNDNRADRLDLYLHPSGEFDTRVASTADGRIAVHAPSIAGAGAAQALSTLRHRQNRALG